MKNGDWSLQLRPVKKPKDSKQSAATFCDGARRRRKVTTYRRRHPPRDASRRRDGVVRRVESELHDALDAADSGLEVVAWTPEVQDAVPYLAAGDLSAVLIGVGLDGIPSRPADRTWLAIRAHGGVRSCCSSPRQQPELVETAFTARRRRRPRASAAGRADLVRDPQGAADRSGRTGGYAGERRRAPRGRVVTVFSPKGGTGKTVLSTNLARVPRGQTRASASC